MSSIKKVAAIMAAAAMASADPDKKAAEMVRAIAPSRAIHIGDLPAIAKKRNASRRKNKAARKARRIARG